MLGVSITAFREKQIVPIIEQFKGIADEIVVSVSKKGWFGDLKADDTAKRALSTGVTVREYEWETEADQRNWTMGVLQKCDYVIVSHADTFFTQEDLKSIKEQLKTADRLHYTCKVHTYWKDFETVIDPNISLPTLIVRRDALFTKAVMIEGQAVDPPVLGGICHHLSWVKTDQEVWEKINSYSHADEIRKEWFEGVWKKWNKGIFNFAPTVPNDYRATRSESLPLEIRKRLV